MTDLIQWLVPPSKPLPDWFLPTVYQFLPAADRNQGTYAAQILWQRGLREQDALLRFLDAQHYQPTGSLAFGPQLEQAVMRLQQAWQQGEQVVIWGTADLDGLTATAVLWDGLSELFQPNRLLTYRIRHRWIAESEVTAPDGQLLIVCNGGGLNTADLQLAQTGDAKVILIEAHRPLAESLPHVVQLNPRALPPEHPFRSLSAVAIAYKLLEALCNALPSVPQRPLTRLLDLVAIGLLASRVPMTGECRYLAQQGTEVLRRNLDSIDAPRPGIAKLLELCRRSGDRPTDISFGLVPRIRAFSQLQADAQSCVELLTSRDRERCDYLARQAELAQARRKALQRTVAQQVRERLTALDLSTTPVIVLADDQWPSGILSFVADQIAQEYGRPTILLTLNPVLPDHKVPLAYGVARSAQPLNFYELLQPQAHLLHRIDGHPQAVDLSLPVENLPLLSEVLNQQLRLHPLPPPTLYADVQVTVAELGPSLFQALKLLEPCGLDNPVPRLLIQNGWFVNIWHRKIRDLTGQKLEYLKTEFELHDPSCNQGFPGVWWGHSKDELPTGRCDVIVELDFNSYEDARRSRRYEIRLIAVRPHRADESVESKAESAGLQIFDQRTQTNPVRPVEALVLDQCPSSWIEFQRWCQQAIQTQHPLVLAYSQPDSPAPIDCWQHFLELAKSLSQTGQLVTAEQVWQRLHLGAHSLDLGLRALSALGFWITVQPQGWRMTGQPQTATPEVNAAIEAFCQAVQEEQFMQQYFVQVPLAVLQAAANPVAQTF